MPEAKRLIISTDLDRTVLTGPVAYSTLKQLNRGEVRLPDYQPLDPDFQRKTSALKTLIAMGPYFGHVFRWPRFGARAGLTEMKIDAIRAGREVSMAALSGRTPPKHGLTRFQLRLFGMTHLYDHGVFLNPGISSYLWKEGNIDEWVQDAYVVHIGDDLREGFAADRANQRWGGQRVTTYLFENKSNSREKVKAAGIALPESIIHVSSYPQLVEDFRQRLLTGQF